MFPIFKKYLCFWETEMNQILVLTVRIFSQLSKDLQYLPVTFLAAEPDVNKFSFLY